MSSFTDDLTVTKQENGSWKVAREFSYYVGIKSLDNIITIPESFTTDFASVPRIFWSIIPPDGKWSQSAVLHDYLYSKHGKLEDKTYSRKQCDKIFLNAMHVLDVSYLRRMTMYRAVRMGGWKSWGGYKFLPKVSKRGITFQWTKKF